MRILKEVFGRSEEEVVSAVRKQLCPALRALLEHGMQAVSVVPAPSASTVGCFNATARGLLIQVFGSLKNIKHYKNSDHIEYRLAHSREQQCVLNSVVVTHWLEIQMGSILPCFFKLLAVHYSNQVYSVPVKYKSEHLAVLK